MHNIAVIGDRASVYGFAALGLDVYFADNAESAVKVLKQLEADNCAVIYITEQIADKIPDELARIAQEPLPAVIPIPCVYGNSGMGMKAVQDSIIKAVGSEI